MTSGTGTQILLDEENQEPVPFVLEEPVASQNKYSMRINEDFLDIS